MLVKQVLETNDIHPLFFFTQRKKFAFFLSFLSVVNIYLLSNVGTKLNRFDAQISVCL